MTDKKVGILIEAIDKSSAVLKGIGAAGKTGLEAVRNSASKAGSALKAVGMAGAFLNQGLELAKKGFELFRMAVLDNITAMVEFRGEADPIAKQFKAMGDDAKYTRAVIGDLLTPAILGFREALNSTGASLTEYINANRRLIATNIIEFLAETARILTTGVGEAVVWVSRAVSGLVEGWNLLAAAVQKGWAVQLDVIAGVMEGFVSLHAMIGVEMPQAVTDAAAAVRGLSDTFSEGADESMAAVEAQVAVQEELEASVLSVQTSVRSFVDVAAGGMLKWADGWDGVKTKADQFNAVITGQQEAWSSLQVSAATYYERVAQFAEKDAAHFQQIADQKLATEKQTAQGIVGLITQLGNAWTSFAVSAMQGSADVGRALATAVIDSVLITINAVAAMAAAKAFAAHQDFPIVGVALGLAAASAAAAIAKGFIADVPAKAERGYRTPAGGSASDVYPVMMRGGEVALDPNQTRLVDRLVGELKRRDGNGGSLTGSGGGGSLHLHQQNVIPPNSVQLQRQLRVLSAEQRRQRGLGFA